MAIRRRLTRMPAAKENLAGRVREVETYEYLLVEYLKEMSNELTYLLMIVCSLFLFVLIGFFPEAETTLGTNYEIVRSVFILLIVGGFMLFGLSSMTKRNIEKKFELILRK